MEVGRRRPSGHEGGVEALVLQAATAGEGVAMGGAHLVDPLIEQGLLVRIGRRRWRTERSFRLIWSSRTPLSPQAETAGDCILASAPVRPAIGRPDGVA